MTRKKPAFDAAQHSADKWIARLKAAKASGTSWEKPWISGAGFALPINASTGNEYRGVNILSLIGEAQEKGYSSNQWASYKQWQAKGCQVKRGETGTYIIFYRIIEKEDGDKLPLIRYSKVFNGCQVEGADVVDVDEKRPSLAQRLDNAETFVSNTGAEILHSDQRRAYYRRRPSDLIHMPNRDLFTDTASSSATENYYSTLLHELTHWTGDKRRLDREKGGRFGDSEYAFEELVAELGSAFLCAHLGITTEPRADHAHYLNSWIECLTDHPKALLTACARASDALDYLRNLQEEKEELAA